MEPVPSTSSSSQEPQGSQPQMDPPYKCNVPGCGKSYRRSQELRAHKQWHDKEGRYVCKIQGCEMRFNFWNTLDYHMMTHTGEKSYLCDVCKRSFYLKSHLKEHQKIHNQNDESFGFKCQALGCERAFKFPFQLRAHIRWHKGPHDHICSLPGCKLRFQTLQHLKKHMKTHNREKPFRCEICGKGYKLSRSLTTHMKRHGQEESVCREPGCRMEFTEKRYLLAHMRWHDGLPEYMCDRTDCEMAFETKRALEQHMRTHTGEKPFKCDVCEKCFTQLGALKRHKKIHIQ